MLTRSTVDKLIPILRRDARRALSMSVAGFPAPYYCSFLLKDIDSFNTWASSGSTCRSQTDRTRTVYCDLRVGSYDYDQVTEGGQGSWTRTLSLARTAPFRSMTRIMTACASPSGSSLRVSLERRSRITTTRKRAASQRSTPIMAYAPLPAPIVPHTSTTLGVVMSTATSGVGSVSAPRSGCHFCPVFQVAG